MAAGRHFEKLLNRHHLATFHRIDNPETQSFLQPRWLVKSEPTKLGMVIEDLEHVFAPRIHFGVQRNVSPLWGAENSWETRPSQLKTPITP